MQDYTPTKSATVETANKRTIGEIGILRAPNGFADSSLVLGARYGLQLPDNDPVIGAPLLDEFQSQIHISMTFAQIEQKLAEAVAAGHITQAEKDQHMVDLKADDDYISPRAESYLDLYEKAKLFTKPPVVARLKVQA